MTLLQTLLTITLQEDPDPILQAYIDTVLPAMEQEFALIPALGGSAAVHRHRLSQQGDRFMEDRIQRWTQHADQSLLVHVLNAILTAWNLLPFLDKDKQLSDDEKRLLCLGLTLHDYNKYCQGEEEDSPKAYEVDDILQLCTELGEKLNFSDFWAEWKNYLSDISFLAQNTQYKVGSNPVPSNWTPFKLADSRRLKNPLRPLLAFGDIAVHISDPSEVTENRGKRLREHLRSLQIDRELVYHRLRDCTGLLSNGIHNAVLHFTEDLDWKPLLFFAQGVVYLAPQDLETPDRNTLQATLWEQISKLLSDKMLSGEAGSKRSGKGLGVAPQIKEFSTPAEIIRQFPDMVIASANFKKPSVLKRLKPEHKDPIVQEQKRKWVREQLEKFVPNDEERELLKQPLEQFSRLGTDGWADCFAELIIFAKKQFFKKNSEFTPWLLTVLEVENQVSPEQAQIERGGTYYGWYYASARYILNYLEWNAEQLEEKLRELANKIAGWAEENNLLPENQNLTRDAFINYINHYLEISEWTPQLPVFQEELTGYVVAKTKAAKEPICSLSSGEFASEDQMDSVVLFKPQQ